MTSLQSRVEKLEADPRVPVPCWFCALVRRASQIFYDYLTERGVTPPEPMCVDEVCRFCGATKPTDVTGLTPEDMEVRRCFWAALDAGDEKAAERYIGEFDARCLARGVATFGEHYAGTSEACDAYIEKWFDENADSLKEAA